MLPISAEPLEDPRHLFAVVGAKRSRPDVAQRAALQEQGGGALVIGGFEDGNDVVGPYGSVDLFEARAVLLGEFLELGSPIDGLRNGPYPLVGPVDQRNVGGHDCFLLPPTFS